LQHQGDAFERETPFGCSELRLELNIHGVGFLLKQRGHDVIISLARVGLYLTDLRHRRE
jgi:hypothetical protein